MIHQDHLFFIKAQGFFHNQVHLFLHQHRCGNQEDGHGELEQHQDISKPAL